MLVHRYDPNIKIRFSYFKSNIRHNLQKGLLLLD